MQYKGQAPSSMRLSHKQICHARCPQPLSLTTLQKHYILSEPHRFDLFALLEKIYRNQGWRRQVSLSWLKVLREELTPHASLARRRRGSLRGPLLWKKRLFVFGWKLCASFQPHGAASVRTARPSGSLPKGRRRRPPEGSHAPQKSLPAPAARRLCDCAPSTTQERPLAAVSAVWPLLLPQPRSVLCWLFLFLSQWLYRKEVRSEEIFVYVGRRLQDCRAQAPGQPCALQPNSSRPHPQNPAQRGFACTALRLLQTPFLRT
mmetsp:Transcript_16734/g.34099  ORF Transcript_16734/g.34099 Transcript_16734/m.34099 type:complete len:261 (+) Transcript_16734:139-921(+)